jgi:hypothetical protein
LVSILKRFKGFECENDEDLCNSSVCLYTGNPDDWVKYMRFDNLCDLIYEYTQSGSNIDPPKCDALGGAWPAGFCNQ